MDAPRRRERAGSGPVTYFEKDFDFELHRVEVEATWDPLVGGGPTPVVAVCVSGGGGGCGAKKKTTITDDDAVTAAAAAEATAAAARAPSTTATNDANSTNNASDTSTTIATPTTEAQAGCWDDFHKQHRGGNFFKERRYLLAEFPSLALDTPFSILEVGCGSGSSCLPVLRANPRAAVLACDFSAAAVVGIGTFPLFCSQNTFQLMTIRCGPNHLTPGSANPTRWSARDAPWTKRTPPKQSQPPPTVTAWGAGAKEAETKTRPVEMTRRRRPRRRSHRTDGHSPAVSERSCATPPRVISPPRWSPSYE
jgi:hypothetical protein